MEVTFRSGGINVELSLSDDAIVHAVKAGPANVLEKALQNPLGLPQLQQCFVPGDRIVIVVDPDTPQLIEVISRVWEQLSAADISELDVTLLLPPDPSEDDWKQLVDELPIHLRNQVSVQIHNAEDEQQRRYLASSAAGERIYLSQHLVDADLIVTIGIISFDSLFGYRGTNSAIYPAMSDIGTIRATRTLGHVELTPDDKRPIRDLTDETGWLLGTQFGVQVIPDSSGGIAEVFCGAVDQVMAVGKQYLKSHWCLAVGDSVEVAIVNVPQCLPQVAWDQFAKAVTAATMVVEDGGSIAVIADLPMPTGPALEMLRRCNEPDELLKPLNREPSHDAVAAIQLIHALQRSRIYLLSNLPDGFVDELGITALSTAGELQRLADSTPYKAVLPAANNLWVQVAASAF